MQLLVDCGNTGIKLGCVGTGAGQSVEHARTVAANPQALTEAIRGCDERVAGVVLLPGNDQHAELFAASWRSGPFRDRPLRRVGADLRLPELGQYQGCGADRLLAGWAAVHALHGDCVIVDAGTATTVDAWRGGDTPVGAVFLGGVILPGAAACLRGLRQAAPRLPAVDPDAEVDGPCQRSTRSAIAAGIAIGYPAMVARCVAQLRAQCAIDRVVLAGGAGASLANAVPHAARHEHLVLCGLARLAAFAGLLTG
ncbi:MAG: type III pantothenate kinase [Planctomycetota bacterium]